MMNAHGEATKTVKQLRNRTCYRIAVCICTFIFLAAAAFSGALAVIYFGPSPAARSRLALFTKPASVAEFVSNIYLSGKEMREILNMDRVAESSPAEKSIGNGE